MFKNMTVKTELILVLGLLSVLQIGVGGLGVYGLNKTNDSFKGVYEDRAVPLGDLALILDRVRRVRLNTTMSAYGRNPDIVKERHALNIQRDGEIESTWQKYMATNLTPEEVILADNFSQQWKVYQDSRNRTMAFATAGDYEAAIANLTGDAAAKFDTAHLAAAPAAAGRGRFVLRYDGADSPTRALVRQAGVLEKILPQLNQSLRLPRDIAVVYAGCDEVNAFYDPEAVAITMCDEYVDYYGELFAGYPADARQPAILGAVVSTFLHEAGHVR